MLKINLRKGLAVVILLFTLYNPNYSQSYSSSPYSSFGLGDLVDANNERNKSMGGIGIKCAIILQ
ncbi:MAG: hypothetical protein R2750_13765 [Bacteroidales bacterium]